MIEVGIAFLVLALGLVPIIGLITGGREQATMSEHQIYAELACYRAQEDHATRHFGFLYRSDPTNNDFFTTLQGIDQNDGTRTGWWTRLTEFQKNAWKAVVPLRSTVSVQRVGPEQGKAIMCIKVSATWGDIGAATKIKQSSYHLLRLRAKRDFGLRSNDGEL
jgi:hypothetical protein